jgi:hypothetical protein
MTDTIQDNMKARAPRRGYFFNEGMTCGACSQGERRKSSAELTPFASEDNFWKKLPKRPWRIGVKQSQLRKRIMP